MYVVDCVEEHKYSSNMYLILLCKRMKRCIKIVLLIFIIQLFTLGIKYVLVHKRIAGLGTFVLF